MDYPETYELVFQASAVEDDAVIVHRTAQAGAGDIRSTKTRRESCARRSATGERYACWPVAAIRCSGRR